MLIRNKRAWYSEMKHALSTTKISMKWATGNLPYELVYKENDFVPSHSEIKVLQLLAIEE